MPRIRDAAAREEANRFCIQEGQHAKFHIDHQDLLLRKHPELEAVRDVVNRSYDDLQRNESTEFALAYATAIELGFKPLAKHLVENRHNRLKVARRTYAHVTRLGARVQTACIACEPPPADDPGLPRISRTRTLALVLGLHETLSPFHDPRHGQAPQWISDWLAADDAGADMTAVAL